MMVILHKLFTFSSMLTLYVIWTADMMLTLHAIDERPGWMYLAMYLFFATKVGFLCAITAPTAPSACFYVKQRALRT